MKENNWEAMHNTHLVILLLGGERQKESLQMQRPWDGLAKGEHWCWKGEEAKVQYQKIIKKKRKSVEVGEERGDSSCF